MKWTWPRREFSRLIEGSLSNFRAWVPEANQTRYCLAPALNAIKEKVRSRKPENTHSFFDDSELSSLFRPWFGIVTFKRIVLYNLLSRVRLGIVILMFSGVYLCDSCKLMRGISKWIASENMFIVHHYRFTTLCFLLCLAKASALFYDNTISMNLIGHMLSLLCISSFGEFNQDVSKNMLWTATGWSGLFWTSMEGIRHATQMIPLLKTSKARKVLSHSLF
jgi:hypothetical protein